MFMLFITMNLRNRFVVTFSWSLTNLTVAFGSDIGHGITIESCPLALMAAVFVDTKSLSATIQTE